MTIETAPTFLRRFDKLEDHGERGAVRQTALRSNRAVTHGCECAFDGVRGPQMLPMLGREVVESQQRTTILAQTFSCFIVFHLVALDEGIERRLGVSLGLGHPNLLQGAFGLRLLALRDRKSVV